MPAPVSFYCALVTFCVFAPPLFLCSSLFPACACAFFLSPFPDSAHCRHVLIFLLVFADGDCDVCNVVVILIMIANYVCMYVCMYVC